MNSEIVSCCCSMRILRMRRKRMSKNWSSMVTENSNSKMDSGYCWTTKKNCSMETGSMRSYTKNSNWMTKKIPMEIASLRTNSKSWSYCSMATENCWNSTAIVRTKKKSLRMRKTMMEIEMRNCSTRTGSKMRNSNWSWTTTKR